MPEIIGIDIALVVVIISIIVAGIALGVGRAFGYKKLERFGLEELAQAIVNAALIGAIVGVVALLSGVVSSFRSPVCIDGNPITELQCSLKLLADDLSLLSQETQRAAATISYYQTLDLDLGAFSIQPLFHLKSMLDILNSQMFQLQLLLILNYLQLTLLTFTEQNAFAYLLSAGLVFRAFFATRRLGAFLLALFIGIYLFYPLFVLLFPVPDEAVAAALENLKSFNENEQYMTQPIVDLNDSYAIAEKFDVLSMRANTSDSETVDITGDLTLLAQAQAQALSRLWIYLVMAPVLSLIVLAVMVRELTAALSAEIGFSTEAI